MQGLEDDPDFWNMTIDEEVNGTFLIKDLTKLNGKQNVWLIFPLYLEQHQTTRQSLFKEIIKRKAKRVVAPHQISPNGCQMADFCKKALD